MQYPSQDSYSAPRSRLTPAVKWILLGTVGAFFAQIVLAMFAVDLATFFGLSLYGLRYGMIWQPVTYVFLHGSPMHLFLNMLGFFFFGPEMERVFGTRSFLKLYFGAGIIGGLGWLVISGMDFQSVCLGASGAVFGVLAAFATLYPHRRITLLLFFILPVTLKAWVMVVAIVVVNLMYLLGGGSGQVAYAAHLAGALAGYLYALSFVRRGGAGMPRPRRRGPRLTVLKGKGEPPELSRDEIDRLLEKIASQGLNSLTPAERRALERASRSR